jgi:exodeoxyribonuclease VII small subunit
MPKTAQASEVGGNKPLPFEEAVQKLETIVDSMESEELPLETLLQRFEEGTRLLRLCQERLAEAELKVQRLEKDLSGDMVARSFDPGMAGTDTETA